MGTRGRGARSLEDLRDARARPQRKLPWERKGLTRLEKVIAFCEWLPITKGKLQGTTMKLLPEQREFIGKIYGERAVKVRLAIKSEPRGNGKTGLIAALALCHLVGPESEPRGEVYSAAIDRQQAAILFTEMEAIVLQVPEFACRVNIQRFHKRMEVLAGEGRGSIYEALSSDARRAHGLSPTLWVYDELAQAKDRVLLDNLMTAMGKRNRSLGIIISTQAPNEDHALSQLLNDAGRGDDPSVVVHLICAPEDADVFDIKVIEACNPALGIFLDREDVLKGVELAKRIPAFEPAHRNLRCNQRVDANADARVVTKDVWDACAVPVNLAKLKGKLCYGGLDLSGKHDLTAFVLIFPDDSGALDVVPFFWTPEGQVEKRKPLERDFFKLWIKQGHMFSIPGPVIQFEWVAKQLAELAAMFDIQCVGYDRWHIEEFKGKMIDAGADIELEPFGQGFKDMGPAVTLFAEKALSGQLRHGGHPVLTACVANAVLVGDAAGNQKFDKDKSHMSSTVRIDGAVALTMALGTMSKFEARQEAPRDFKLFYI